VVSGSDIVQEGQGGMEVKMTIKGLMIDPVTNMPIVVLRDADGERVLPIWVGLFEANAIALQIESVQTPRPMTHDLLVSVIGSLAGRVERVVVSDLRDNTFYATIMLRSPTGDVPVDARPSDAIAIALRTGSPIFVEEAVFETAQEAEKGGELDEMGRLRRWLENLGEEELGKYKM
jgi:bifunctional DNase/RNase